MAQLDSGEERGRIEVSPPSGYSELKPRMWYEDSEDSNVATVVLEFILPGVTPGQAHTFSRRYTTEERGLGTEKIVQVSASGVPARAWSDMSNSNTARTDVLQQPSYYSRQAGPHSSQRYPV
jgi:hypothetical protein